MDRIVNVIEDVTEVKNAEVRQRILAEATRVLSAAPDREQGLAGVAAVVVPDLADWCAVDVDGPAASAGREPAAGDERLVVGLRAGGGELGTLTLGRARPFSDEDRALAEELGRRAAIAVLDARLSEERAEITRELQEGLRPPELPAVPGLRTATLYRPAGELNDVGGDFYDAFATDGGLDRLHRRRGRPGSARGDPDRSHALHAAVRRPAHRRPRDRDRGGQPRADRAARARARHARGGPAAPRDRRTSWCSGRSRPATRSRCSSATAPCASSARPGPIAGVFEDAEWPMTDTPLQRGDTIVLYTDGVLDTVGDDGRFGDERLLALLDGAPADPTAVVARIDAALAAFQAGPQRDDTAIVVITVDDVHASA